MGPSGPFSLEKTMIETALIDGDIVAYRCSAATENESEDIAKWQTSEFMRRLLNETNAMQYKCFLSGSNNFRYDIYPEYKANRKDLPKPKWLQLVREHLVTDWQATVTDGIEADDALGIEQCCGEDTIIITIDKDLWMIPGRHYAFETRGKSTLGKEWVKPAEFRQVSPLMGLRHFYGQLILGDRADNIFGFDGKARAKVPGFLQEKFDLLELMDDEQDMYDIVYDMYHDKEQMKINGKVLWIMRREEDYWLPPNERPTTEESGQKDDFTVS